MKEYTTLTLEQLDSNVVTLKINRPEVRNALNTAFWLELREVLTELSSTKVLIITGDEKAFSSGADLKESKTRPPKDYEVHLLLVQEVSQKLFSCDIPTIAAIDGYALGAGIELALACDIRIASSEAIIGFPEAKVSSSVTGGTLRFLPDLVGFAKAKELLFSCEQISAEEACRIGLVQRVVERSALLDEATKLARQIAGFSSESIAGLKRGLARSQLGESLVHLMKYEVQSCLKALRTEDRKKALEKY